MKHTPSLRIALLLTMVLASGCATVRAPEPPPASHNTAVLALLDTAHADLENGRFAAATAALERALRIEPRNPVLWQELARAHLREGNYTQAENFAARSNSWAGGNRALLASNWQIIAEARMARGDAAGAQQALERAGQFR
ncbi:MAG: tetratricopeptide repeat protein [Thiohalomonadaceae bacterium]